MGSLTLCHAKKARQPYEISRIHKKIYTIEELNYYVYHHLYLIDYTFANHKLCDWISDELELDRLSEDLKNILNEDGATEDFVYRILSASSQYSESEICMAMEVLQEFNEQTDVEKAKFKADQLMQNGEFESAVFIYLRIINNIHEDMVDPVFYGKIYACLGSAYGKLFLYEQAAKMYEEACKYLSDEEVVRAYIYSCYHAYSDEIYQEILLKDPHYQEIDQQIKERLKQAKETISLKETEVQIHDLKNNNRGFLKN